MKLYIAWIIQCLQLMQFCRCEDKRYEVDSNTPFWANRGRRGDDTGPFWANRGRRTDKRPTELTSDGIDNEWSTQLEEPMYIEEPRWILVRRDDERRASSYIAPDYQPYFVTRGKRPQHRSQHETNGPDALGQDRIGKTCDNYASCNRVHSAPCGDEANNKISRRAHDK